METGAGMEYRVDAGSLLLSCDASLWIVMDSFRYPGGDD